MNYDPNNILNSEETNFVKLSVYQSLEAENALLKAEVERLTKQNALATPRHLIASQDIKTLREQVERLTKAGDNLVYVVTEHPVAEPFVKAWFAAKEGKPRA